MKKSFKWQGLNFITFKGIKAMCDEAPVMLVCGEKELMIVALYQISTIILKKWQLK